MLEWTILTDVGKDILTDVGMDGVMMPPICIGNIQTYKIS